MTNNRLKQNIIKNKNHKIKDSQVKIPFIENKRINKMKFQSIRKLTKSKSIINNKTNNLNSNI